MKKISSSLFDNFLENNIEGIWVIDTNNKTTFVNSVTSKLFGYPQDYFIGKEIKDFLEEGQCLVVDEKLEDRKHGTSENHELKFLKPDSDPIWVSATCTPLYNENDVYVGAVGLMTDITQRKKNETILEAQKNVFESLIKVGNLETALIHLLRPVEKLMNGVLPSILLLDESGEHLKTGVSIGLPDEYNKAIHGGQIGLGAGSCGTSAYTKKLVISADISTDPNWINYKDIAEKHQLRACWSSPIISYHGKVLGTFAMYFQTKKFPSKFELELVNDITAAAALCIEHIRLLDDEKKNTLRVDFIAEARFLLSGTIEYEDVLKKLPDLFVRRGMADWSYFVLAGKDGIYRPNCVSAIPSLKEAVKPLEKIEMDTSKDFGVAKSIRLNQPVVEDFTEKKLASFLGKPGPDTPSAFLIDLLIKLQLRSFICVPLTSRRKVIGAIVLGSQQPDRRYTKSDLELVQEVSRSCSLAIDNALLYRESKKTIEAREDFISVASHELRTPITSLKMRIDLLAMMIERGKFPEEVNKVLRPIVSELQPDVKNFTRLIEALLDISTIRDKDLTLSRELCDISAIIKDEAAKLKVIFDNNQTDLIFEIQEGIKGSCDETRIRQIINNLLTNALKFGDKKPVSLIVKGDGLLLSVWVKDNGIGISQEDFQRIFKPFERAVSDQYFGGLGLGLYITERIIKSHGGTIEVDSKPGQGATFKVEIPLFWKS